jgi:hypothetical protein
MNRFFIYGAFAALALTLTHAEDARPKPYVIRVVDDETGCGVPLVELKTTNELRFYTDSAGVVAFDEPGLLGRTVYFHVFSHGYQYPADGFGNRGVTLHTAAAQSATVKLKRLNKAERLYRITGAGIYAESLRAGLPVPIQEPALNAGVMGQDSVQLVEFGGKLRWFFGDTNRVSYPLGNYGSSGAVSARPQEGLHPETGIDLTYFTDRDGFSRALCAVEGPGTKWIDAVSVLDGGTTLLARYTRNKSLGETVERGWLRYDAKEDVFKLLTKWKMDGLWWPCSQTLEYKVNDVEYLYFCYPYPYIRVRKSLDAVQDPHQYETYTCLMPGAKYEGKNTKLDRDANGDLRWAWKLDTAPLSQRHEHELIAQNLVKPEEAHYAMRDPQANAPVSPHSGSVNFNPYRNRWVMILDAESVNPSYLGEVYYAEAQALEGPWTTATKIVTHEKYSFYNVVQHPQFDEQKGKIIYFEGTYTSLFSGVQVPTPRYDYNQIMYRLDLTRLKLDQP